MCFQWYRWALDWLGAVSQGILHDRPVFGFADNNAYGGVFLLFFDFVVQDAQIKLHFTGHLRREFPYFEVYGDQASQLAVEEQQIDKDLWAPASSGFTTS